MEFLVNQNAAAVLALVIASLVTFFSGDVTGWVNSAAARWVGATLSAAIAVFVYLKGENASALLLSCSIPVVIGFYMALKKQKEEMRAMIENLDESVKNQKEEMKAMIVDLDKMVLSLNRLPEELQRPIRETLPQIFELNDNGAGDKVVFLAPVADSFSRAVDSVANSGEVFFSKEVFSEFWKNQIERVDKYISVSDLQPYSVGATKVDIHTLIQKSRSDLDALVGTKKSGVRYGRKKMQFDKIFLYAPVPSSVSGDYRPPCANGDNSTCKPNAKECKQQACVVKNAVAEWVERQRDFNELFDSNINGNTGGGPNVGQRNVWIMSREDFRDRMIAIERGGGKDLRIRGTDIGLFGEDLVGEEYKVVRPDDELIYTYIFYHSKSAANRVVDLLNSSLKDGELLPCN